MQALLDKIAQKLVEKMVTSDTFQTVLGKYLVNNGLTTEAGKFGLDAAFGKNLQDQITQQNSNIENTTNRVTDLENNKVSKSGDVITGAMHIKKINGSTGTDWQNAAVHIESLTNQNQYSRASLSLENTGINACLIYLDTDGALRVVDHAGNIKTIQTA